MLLLVKVYQWIKHGHCLLICGKSVVLGTYWMSHGSKRYDNVDLFTQAVPQGN